MSLTCANADMATSGFCDLTKLSLIIADLKSVTNNDKTMTTSTLPKNNQ